jgi:acyl phosphate:glycerol-3-phosphate acyltransferase
MTLVAYAIAAYLIGSLPFAVIVSKLMGLPDPRSYGSGNPGTTNVLRSGSKIAALLTLIGDGAKGWFAVWLAMRLGADAMTLAVVAFAVFIGHVFSVWLAFKGGKGVATACGVLLALDWRVGVATLVVWLTIVVVSRYSSLAALVGALFAPFAMWHYGAPEAVLYSSIAMCAVLVWRHQANILKLLKGEESRIFEKSKDPPGESADAAES